MKMAGTLKQLMVFKFYSGLWSLLHAMGGGGVARRGRLPGLPNQVTNSPGLNFAMQKFQRGVTQLAGIRFILTVNNPEKVYPGICVGNLIFI